MTTDSRLSVRPAARWWAAGRAHHDEARHTPFLAALTARALPWKGYAELLAQLYFMHESLAQAETVMEPRPGVLRRSATVSLPALAADLHFLYGSRWQRSIAAYPATAAYCTDVRHRAVRDVRGFAAHHHARHLEDLFTGAELAPAVSLAYGIDDPGARYLRSADTTAGHYHGECRTLSADPAGVIADAAGVHRMYLLVLGQLGGTWC